MSKSIDETHEWRKLRDFKAGDYILGFGQEMLVTKVEVVGDMIVRLSYIHEDIEKLKIDAVRADYIARKRG